MSAALFGPSGPDLWIRIRGRTVGAIVCNGFRGVFVLLVDYRHKIGKRSLALRTRFRYRCSFGMVDRPT